MYTGARPPARYLSMRVSSGLSSEHLNFEHLGFQPATMRPFQSSHLPEFLAVITTINFIGISVLGITDYMFKHENSLFLRALFIALGAAAP